MFLVDTNIFLEMLLLQTRKQECALFLQTLKTGKNTAVVTDFTIHSIIVIMSSLNKIDGLKIFLQSLTAFKGLHVHNTTLSEEINATELATQCKLDMDDAIQYAVALSIKAQAIISFDKHFDHLQIPKITPKQTK
jgi:predicted nucleic acid-binding protein